MLLAWVQHLLQLLSKQEWKRLLEEQGFAVVDYHYCDSMGWFIAEKRKR